MSLPASSPYWLTRNRTKKRLAEKPKTIDTRQTVGNNARTNRISSGDKMATIDRPYLSATQLESVCRCGEAYRRRYIEREIIPPGIAMLKGTGFHLGAKFNMRQKIESRIDLPAKDIVAFAVSSFDDATKGGYLLSDDETAIGAANVIGKAKDDLAEMADVHATIQAPDYQPVLVEETIRIELPGPRDLLGILDLADDQDRVTDFKTAGKSKSQADADDNVGLTVYSLTFKARTGRMPKAVRLDSVIQTKTKTSRQVVTSERTEHDFVALSNRINAVTKAIEAGNFVPASPGNWYCSPKWCGYWSTCPHVNSHRKALVQIGE